MRMSHFEMFKVLGVESRIRIIELLKSKGPLGVKVIAEELGITPAAVSQHLKVLKQAGFVSCERQGYYIPYSIDIAALGQCCGHLMQVCSCDCLGGGKNKHHSSTKSELEFLKKYKKDLERELQRIKERIANVKNEE